MRIARRKKELKKLNLIPILDAVFIFIFFLLMSAQFIDIYKIGGEAPIVSKNKEEIDKKKPLNLIVHISKRGIYLKKGLDESTVKVYTSNKKGLNDLKMRLLSFSKEFPNEKSVIIRPERGVPYKNIVLVLDAIKGPSDEKSSFKQIIFETVI